VTNFSLRHRIKLPGGTDSSLARGMHKCPLLILCHEIGGHEDQLMELANQFDNRFTIISVRAPFEQTPTSFTWFRVSPFMDDTVIYIDDAGESRLKLVQFIHEAVSTYDVDAEQVYLFGFGQGATIALSIALTDPGLLRGLAAISGEVLPESIHMRTSQAKLSGFPIFLGYGIHDQVISLQVARKTRDLLSGFSDEISYREFSVGHQLTVTSVQAASNWLTQRLDINRRANLAVTSAKMHLGHIQLHVRDLDRSIAFYKRYLDMRVTERVGKVFAFLSLGYHHHDLALQYVGPEALDPPPNTIGVVNVAFEVLNQLLFAEVYKSLLDGGIEVRTADHFVSWSMYFDDPDGNNIEIYCDTRDVQGRSDLWQGRDLPLEHEKIVAFLTETYDSATQI
jgi:predicted esterase/catechol 2,3-dioxygenase-like lactoylglutathione lyase family enzyme